MYKTFPGVFSVVQFKVRLLILKSKQELESVDANALFVPEMYARVVFGAS